MKEYNKDEKYLVLQFRFVRLEDTGLKQVDSPSSRTEICLLFLPKIEK